ncbi:MAG: antitoxin [Thermoleophilaceae bacterium]
MPRTTIDLDGSVLEGLRRVSRREAKSMGQLASELLAPALAGTERSRTGVPAFTLRTARLGEPRVDLEDKDALRAALEERSG